jgi:hypothetical protein
LYAEYDFEKYNSILSKALSQGNPIYSGAYIMSSGKGYFGHKRKHTNHLRLIEMMMEEAVPQRVVAAKSMRKVFEILLSYPGLGDFLAYQFAVDINYSTLTDFSEMAFVVPGPGARDGIRKCFKDTGGLDDIDLIKLMADRQEAEFQRLGLTFQSLWGRPLQLIDCQNLFCEADKYARVAHPTARGVSGRTRIKQKYRTNEKPFEYWYPPKWRLNDLVKRPV